MEIDIPGFIGLIAEGKFKEAAQRMKEKNALSGSVRTGLSPGIAV